MKKFSFQFNFYSLLVYLFSALLFLASCSEEVVTSPTTDNGNGVTINGSIVYKPFDEDNQDKFSLGDVNNPYLVEVREEYTNLAEPLTNSTFTVDGTAYGVVREIYDNRIFLGLSNFTYANYTAANFDSFTLTLGISIARTGGDNVSQNVSLNLKDNTVNKAPAGEIYGWRDLQNISLAPGEDYVQVNDITFPAPGSDRFPSAGFNPIGNPIGGGSGSLPFTGSYDGAGNNINNLFINRDEDNVAIFANVGTSATIKDLTVSVNRVSGELNVGSIVGTLDSGATLTNVNATNVSGGTGLVTGNDVIGGLVGLNDGGTIYGYATVNVSSTGTSSAVSGTGGLVGFTRNLGDSIGYAEGNVSGSGGSPLGGLSGGLSSSARAIGYATGQVSSTGSGSTGGLVGNSTSGGEAFGYWDKTSTGQDSSAGGGVGISAIGNVTFSSDVYTDSSDSTVVFDNANFLAYFGLPEAANTWPTFLVNIRNNGNNGGGTTTPTTPRGTFTYKPFDAGHQDKFSLGDFNNPYLIELTGDYTNLGDLTGTSLSIDGTDYGVSPTLENDRFFLGLTNFTYANYTAANFDTFTLKLAVTLGSGSRDLTLDLVDSTFEKAPANQIYTWRDLQNIREDATASYVQMNDITFPAPNTQGLPNEGFDPIAANNGNQFSGSYDGSGHRINNFFINRPSEEDIGLFKSVGGSGSGTVIKDLVLDLANITGSFRVGSLVGELSSGLVTNVGAVSSTRGTVTGTDIVGGLVGSATGGTIFGYVTANVSSRGTGTGDSGTGGLVGVSTGSSLTVGYTTGNVSAMGASYTGGLIGNLSGFGFTSPRTVGYATGQVSSTRNDRTGGLVGYLSRADIYGYWDVASSGQSQSFGDRENISTGTLQSGGISSIDNVSFIPPNVYRDGGVATFNNDTFLGYFGLPGEAGAWPLLGNFENNNVKASNTGDDNVDNSTDRIIYKPFDADHQDKFSLGDFNNPYLIELRGNYRNLSSSTDSSVNGFNIDGTRYGIARTVENGRTYLGIDGLSYANYSSSSLTSFSLSLQVSNTSGTGTTDQSFDLANMSITKTATNGIYTWRDLQNMQHNLAGSYQQMNNLSLPNPGADGLPAEGFVPIGVYDTNPFTGSYDGNDHRINNFFINRGDQRGVGLFGYISGNSSIIQNVTVDLGAIGITGNGVVGAIAGSLENGTVTNAGVVSSSGGGVAVNNDTVGGLVGLTRGGNIHGYATVNISSSGYNINEGGAGGLAGITFDSGTIIGYATGDVIATGGGGVGGLVSALSPGSGAYTVIGYATGRLSSSGGTSSGSSAGGLVGYAETSSTVYGYWDEASTEQDSSVRGGVGISAIGNVTLSGGTYTDNSGTPSDASDDVAVFDDATFLNHFDLPGQSGAWPTLK